MGAETIKEFLVSLGYKVDGSTEKKFKESIRSATKAVAEIGLGLAAAATAVAYTVQKVEKEFNRLYFMANRTGASIKNIEALSYAVSQLGGSYEGAQASIEAFGQRLATNPGYKAMVAALGVNPNQDATKAMVALGAKFANMPKYIGFQYASELGLDYKTFLALRSGQLAGWLKNYNEAVHTFGLDSKEAGERGKAFSQTLSKLGTDFSLLKDRIVSDLSPAMTKWMNDLDNWMRTHPKEIENALIKIKDALIAVARYMRETVTALTDQFIS